MNWNKLAQKVLPGLIGALLGFFGHELTASQCVNEVFKTTTQAVSTP